MKNLLPLIVLILLLINTANLYAQGSSGAIFIGNELQLKNSCRKANELIKSKSERDVLANGLKNISRNKSLNQPSHKKNNGALLADSIVLYDWFSNNDSVRRSKRTFNYDVNGNRTLSIDFEWDNNIQEWTGIEKHKDAYDNYGNITSEERFEWDINLNDWALNYRSMSELEYDPNGNITSKVFSSWHAGWGDDDNQWTNRQKEEYTYDEQQEITSSAHYWWDDNQNRWNGEYKTELSYDTQQNVVARSEFRWNYDEADWYLRSDYKYEYSFNAMNLPILIEGFTWNSVTQEWDEYDREELSYDEYGKQILILKFNWDANAQGWSETQRVEYEYDANLKMTLYSYFTCNGCEGRYEFSYNENNELISLIFNDWDQEKNEWYKKTREDYESIDNGTTRLTKFYSWDANTNDWQTKWLEYKYRTSFEAATNYAIKLYPNPTQGLINIEGSDFEKAYIVDLSGKTVLQTNRQNIDLSALEAGVYFIRVFGKNNKSSTLKLIKQRDTPQK